MNNKYELTITCITHVGRVRENNEDSIGVGSWFSVESMGSLRTSAHTTEKPVVVAVADGIGGHQAGDVASKYVIERVLSFGWTGGADDAAVECLQGIHNDIRLMMQNTPGHYGMGATIVGVVIFGNEIMYFNLGDSRLYRWNDSSIVQLSTDDRPQELEEDGQLGRSNILTQALGGTYMKVQLNPHMGRSVITSGEKYLLCSDGLTDMVSNDEILNILDHAGASAVEELLEKALEKGGDDNISVIVIEVK